MQFIVELNNIAYDLVLSLDEPLSDGWKRELPLTTDDSFDLLLK